MMKTEFWLGLMMIAASWVSAAELPATAVPENRDCDLFRHQVAEMEKGETDLLWVGDSITDFWDDAGIDVWNRYYVEKGRRPLNFGISGDRTSQVIWRIDNAPTDKIAPKMIILMIGTNNLAHGDSPEDTVVGIQTIVSRLTGLYPDARLLLLEIFPRDARPGTPLRALIEDANARLRAIYGADRVPNVQLYSIGDLFLDEEGNLPESIMPDYLHPSAAGYEIWAEAVEPMVMEGLGETPEPAVPKTNAMHDERYTKQVEQLKERQDYQILMCGDSIVGVWMSGPGTDRFPVWEKYYGSKGGMNLGVGGDIVSGLAWRMENYPLGEADPKLIITEIGANDLTCYETPKEEVAFGLRVLIKKLHARWPKARFIAVACLPFQWEHNPNHDAMTFQSWIDGYNRIFPLYFRDLPYVTAVNISDLYVFPDGKYNPDVLYDSVHPNAVGCALWGERLNPLVETLLEEYDQEE